VDVFELEFNFLSVLGTDFLSVDELLVDLVRVHCRCGIAYFNLFVTAVNFSLFEVWLYKLV